MTVWKAIAEWHCVRGLPAPTAKDRRQRLMQRGRQLYEEEGWQIKDIAAEFGYSPRGMKLLIEQSYKVGGRETIDAAAKKFRGTPGRISQIRRKLEQSWRTFQGEETSAAAVAAVGN